MWINNRTGFSFREVYGHIDDVVLENAQHGTSCGIADYCNTFGHVKFRASCKALGVKPIFGVRIPVTEFRITNNVGTRERRYPHYIVTLIARNNKGLKEIHRTVNLAWSQFYWRPIINFEQLQALSKNVVVIASSFAVIDRVDRHIYLGLSPDLPRAIRSIRSVPVIACIDNYYPTPADREIYEALIKDPSRKTTPQWILSEDEWLQQYPDRIDAIDELQMVSRSCNADLTTAPMVSKKFKKTVRQLCEENAKALDLNLDKNPIYRQRLESELELIKDKGFEDYFLIVHDLVSYAKARMLVGPGRGSAAGSLVCYLLGITTVDPIKYGLLFERFIDVHRSDMPDIDIDFQQDKRKMVFDYAVKTYGADCVAKIANVSTLQKKSAALVIKKNCVLDEAPADLVKAVIGHPDHSSVHAAGLLISGKPLDNYCSINPKDGQVAQVDKYDAEALGLLKIDALGLRTLSIIDDTISSIVYPGNKLGRLSIFDQPMDDPAAYELLNSGRFAGIFQFEGETAKRVAQTIHIKDIEDITAITSIARPGPLSAGIDKKYAAKPGPHHIIYQEQVMALCRVYAGMSWEDIGALRKGLSKSYGDDFFDGYREKFIQGAIRNGHKKKKAIKKWNEIKGSGNYLFNRSHALCYSVITYWTAFLKANYPLQFAIACLDHAKDKDQMIALLRDFKEHDGIDYIPVDPKLSIDRWTYHNKTLLGPLQSIKGVGVVKARQIMKLRQEGKPYPAGISRLLQDPETEIDTLYPTRDLFGHIYKNPFDYVEGCEVAEISKAKSYPDTTFAIIGRVKEKKLIDLNSPEWLAKNDGQLQKKDRSRKGSILIEDDSGIVKVTINQNKFSEVSGVFERAKKDKTWLIIVGTYSDEWNVFYCEDMEEL